MWIKSTTFIHWLPRDVVSRGIRRYKLSRNLKEDAIWKGCYFLYVCAKLLQSCSTLCDPWTVAHQAPLSMGFSRQEHWSELPFPSPGDLPYPGIEPIALTSPTLPSGLFTTRQPRKPYFLYTSFKFHSFELDFKSYCLPRWYLWTSQVEINSLRFCWPHLSCSYWGVLKSQLASRGSHNAGVRSSWREPLLGDFLQKGPLCIRKGCWGNHLEDITPAHVPEPLVKVSTPGGVWIPTCFSCHWNCLYKESRNWMTIRNYLQYIC